MQALQHIRDDHMCNPGRRPAFEPFLLKIPSDESGRAGVAGMWHADQWKGNSDELPRLHLRSGLELYISEDVEYQKGVPCHDVQRAWRIVDRLDDRTTATFLVATAKWFIDSDLGRAGLTKVRVHVNDILDCLGMKKHAKGDYRTEQKRRVRDDLLALSRIWIKSQHQVLSRGGSHERREAGYIEARLLEVAIESDDTAVPYAFRVCPGEWIAPHVGVNGATRTALLPRAVLQYDPRAGVERIAMRLGIHLAMHWRIRRQKNNISGPWIIERLLDSTHLEPGDPRRYRRFISQFESALQRLKADRVIEGWRYSTASTPSGSPHGGCLYRSWLAHRLVIVPGQEILARYGHAEGEPVWPPATLNPLSRAA